MPTRVETEGRSFSEDGPPRLPRISFLGISPRCLPLLGRAPQGRPPLRALHGRSSAESDGRGGNGRRANLSVQRLEASDDDGTNAVAFRAVAELPSAVARGPEASFLVPFVLPKDHAGRRSP